MIIRNTTEEDKEAVCKLHVESFGAEEGPSISKLVLEILNIKTKEPVYSFAIEDVENNIIGHIIFSPVTIESAEEIKGYILAPLAISVTHQKKGLGTKLINYGVDQLKNEGIEAVFVLGDPNYYGRAGFKTERNISTPYKSEYPPETWMRKELVKGVLSNARGIIKCISPFMSKEHW